MPHCCICDRNMDSAAEDPRDGSAVPCSVCLDIISEAVGDAGDEIQVVWIESDLNDFSEEISDVRRYTD